MALHNLVPFLAVACTDDCSHAPIGGLASLAGASPPGATLPMLAIVGGAGIVLCLLQAIRGKRLAAFLSLVCGIGLLGTFLAARPSHHKLIEFSYSPDTGRPFFVFHPASSDASGQIRLPGWDEEGKIREIIETRVEQFETHIEELGPEFRTWDRRKLREQLETDHALIGLSDLRDSTQSAEKEARRDAARELRERVQEWVSREFPSGGLKIDKHSERLEQFIEGTLDALGSTGQLQIVTQQFGSPEMPRYRAALRADPENIAQRMEEKANDFLETRVLPRGRRIATTVLSMAALGVLVFLAYLFVNSGTRGQFGGTLRVMAAVAFVGMCAALWYFVP